MSDDDLTAEARQYAWAGATCKCPTPGCEHRTTGYVGEQAHNRFPTNAQLREAQADADRHLRNARHLGGLLEQIARTLDADPLDLNEIPDLVDGLHTARNQAAARVEGLEARSGAYLLAHDHLAAVTRILVASIHQHITRSPAGNHLLTQADRDRLLTATDTVHEALSRDLSSYLADPDDITPETRVDLTPAGLAATAHQRLMTGIAEQVQDLTKKWTPALAKGGIIRENTCRCTWLGIGTPEHPPASLCLTPEHDQANRQRASDSRPDWWTADHEAAALAGIADRTASVPRVARESKRPIAVNRPCDPGYEPGDATLCFPCSCTAGTQPAASGPTAPRAWTPLPENWGPYSNELQTRLEPMPVAVDELHDAGLVRSGDPDRVVRDVVLAHLVAAAEAARVELGAFDRRILEWLARGELPTAQVVIGLIRRAFDGGRGAQRYWDTLRGQTTMESDNTIMVIMVSSQKGRFGRSHLPGGAR